jgi:hypothetical protein
MLLAQQRLYYPLLLSLISPIPLHSNYCKRQKPGFENKDIPSLRIALEIEKMLLIQIVKSQQHRERDVYTKFFRDHSNTECNCRLVSPCPR